MTEKKSDYEHLFDISITTLNLSDKAYKALMKTGMSTVGDCVDFYIRGNDVLISARTSSFEVLANELKEKMVEFGYWDFVEKHLKDKT